MVETLKVVTETTVQTTTVTTTEEKYKVVAPETMQESFMTDSEDEGGESQFMHDIILYRKLLLTRNLFLEILSSFCRHWRK